MLTDKQIQNAKARATLYRLLDGEGLYLEVSSAGGRLWRFRYRFAGKEKMLALGKYPQVRGPVARKLAGEARQVLSEGRDPGAEKQAAKERARIASDIGFEAIATQWHAKLKLADSTRAKHVAFFANDVFP